jgi:hypothetical protein
MYASNKRSGDSVIDEGIYRRTLMDRLQSLTWDRRVYSPELMKPNDKIVVAVFRRLGSYLAEFGDSCAFILDQTSF